MSGVSSLRSSRGQVVVEYALLLILGVVLALIITNAMVSRNADSPGFVVRKWYDIIVTIGADQIDQFVQQ